VGCPTPAQHIVCQAYIRAVTEHTARLQRLAQALHEPVKTWRLQPVGEAWQGLRGVQCTVAVTLVAALGDLTRVDNPRQLMSDLGLIPSDYSRGDRRRQGGITKAGNTHARPALIEGAWAYRAIRPRSAAISSDDSKRGRNRFRISVGRPTCGCAPPTAT
jgi:transposase